MSYRRPTCQAATPHFLPIISAWSTRCKCLVHSPNLRQGVRAVGNNPSAMSPGSRSIRRSHLLTAMAVEIGTGAQKGSFERRSSQRPQLHGLDPVSAAVGDCNESCAGGRAHCRAHWAGGIGISRVPAPVGGSNPGLGRVLRCGQCGMHRSGLAGALTLGVAARGPCRPGNDPCARTTLTSARWRSTSIRCRAGRFPGLAERS